MSNGLEFEHDKLREICQRYHVERLELFGSRARGDAAPESDVDVLVTFAPGINLGLSYFGLPLELEELFGRPVDMIERPVVERDRNPYFRTSVLEATELLYVA